MTFFNSNFFVGLVTLIAGSVALYLYWRQKRDSKRDYANIILLEIQNAERAIDQVQEQVRQRILPNKTLLPDNSWSKYRYRFVRDFDRDEWDTISAFYNACRLYDVAVLYNDSFFQKNEEQIRVNLLRTTSDYFKNFVDTTAPITEPQDLARAIANATKFQQTLLANANLLLYTPQKPITDAQTYLLNMTQKLSLMSIGSKLKRLAGHKVRT